MWGQPDRGGGAGGHRGGGRGGWWMQNINTHKMAAAANWSSLPLPSGWQAVWDQAQNCYFFIDHNTRTTTWTDPRETIWEQMNMPTQNSRQNSPYAGHAQTFEMTALGGRQTQDQTQHWTSELNPGTLSSWLSSREEMTIEETMFTQGSSDGNRHMKTSHEKLPTAGSRRSSTQQHKLALLKLMAEFPETERELVSDLLESNFDNETETRKVLKELGYKHHTPSPSRTQSPSGGSTSRAMSPSSTKTVRLTASEKATMKRKLQREFNVSQTVVEMALEVSMYDEAKAQVILHNQSRLAETSTSDANNGVTQSSRSSVQQAERKDASHSRSVTPSFGNSTSLSGSQIIETNVHVHTNDSAHSGSRTTVSTTPPSRSGSATPRARSATPRALSPVRDTPQTAPKTVVTTRTAKPARTERKKKSPTVKNLPDYVSQNRTLAKGPDPTFVVGPQITNLIAVYGNTIGPNLSNVKGPDIRNRVGPGARPRTPDHLAAGPDPSLRHGPQG